MITPRVNSSEIRFKMHSGVLKTAAPVVITVILHGGSELKILFVMNSFH